MARGGRGAGSASGGFDDEIVDGIYSVALDPERFAELMERWDVLRRESEGLRSTGAHGFDQLQAPAFAPHLDRAAAILDRLSAPVRVASAELEAQLAAVPTAAFAVSLAGVILAANAETRESFGIAPGDPVERLPLSPDDAARLRATIEGLRERDGALAPLRLARAPGDRLMVLQIRPIEHGPVTGRAALVVTTEFVWPPGLDRMLADMFALSAAEIDVTRALVMGASVGEIAATRGRSILTVRSQVRALLAKTGAQSQGELVRLSVGLMDIARAANREPVTLEPAALAARRRNDWRIAEMGDGRRLAYLDLGQPRGRPFLWLPSTIGMARWTTAGEAALYESGLRMIVPIRAGFGPSDPSPTGRHAFQGAAEDMLKLMDILEIRVAPIVSVGQDFAVAAYLATLAPRRVSSIIAVAPVTPTHGAHHYERMHVWQRFIASNARFAPTALPFLVKAGFQLARSVGKPRFASMVFGRAPADRAALADPDVMEALLLGSEQTLSDAYSAHAAFAAEVAAFKQDWSGLIDRVEAPITLFAGEEDPECPIATLQETLARHPRLGLVSFPGEGRLIALTRWRDLIRLIALATPAPQAVGSL